MNNTNLNALLGNVPEVGTGLINNWQTAFIWLVIGIIAFALIALFFGIKRVSKGENVNKGMLPYVKWPLLFASAGFNVFFTYYVFLPAGQSVALFSAVVMGGVNLAEAYLVRLIIATWRHGLKTVFLLALCFTVPVFVYSLMAAGSSFTTMMKKNQDTLIASQLELQSAKDSIGAANSAINEAEAEQQKGIILASLYQTPVRNSQGRTINFAQIKSSCDRGGYYSINYPDLCEQYKSHRNGTYTALSVASANTEALQVSATKKLEMAQIIKDRPPEITPTLLGFALGLGAVGFIVSLALESAIIGVGFFEELFIKPTPLPAIVNFMNKSLDWDANTITQRGLQVDISPSPGAVNFAKNGSMASPFSSVGWSPQNPHSLPHNKDITSNENTSVQSVQDNVQIPVQDRTDTDLNTTVTSENGYVTTSGNTPVIGNTKTPIQSVQESVPKHTDTDEQKPKTETEQGRTEALLREMKERNEQAQTAKIGDTINCVTCGAETEKRIETKRFCSAPCRIEFHKLAKKFKKKEAEKTKVV